MKYVIVTDADLAILLDYLRNNAVGEKNAKTAKQLSFIDNPRMIRKTVSSLRQKGFPICSGDMGYYYGETENEIMRTVRRLENMRTNLDEAVKGLKISIGMQIR